MRYPLKYYAGLFVIALVALVFLLANLGDRPLWDDEAQTAVLARQVAMKGLPQFTAGQDMPTDRLDFSDFNKDRIFIFNTWLPYYLTAVSFKIFGSSEWSARLPFAIFGFLTILLYLIICLRLYETKDSAVLIAFMMLVFSVPFLLHMRQCRYYSIIAFGTLLMIFGYLLLTESKKWGWVYVVLGGLLCFHSFYITAVLNLTGLCLYALLREKRRDVLRMLGLSATLIIIASLPFFLYMRLWDHPFESPVSFDKTVRSLWVYLLWINGFVFPFVLPAAYVAIRRKVGWPFLICAFVLFVVGASTSGTSADPFFLAAGLCFTGYFLFTFSRRYLQEDSPSSSYNRRETITELTLIFAMIYIFSLSVVAPFPYFRYLIPVVPLVLLSGSLLVSSFMRVSKTFGIVIVILFLSSNVWSSLPLRVAAMVSGNPRPGYSLSPREIGYWTDIRSDLFSFLYEISNKISDPEKGIISYLRENGKKGETIKASYGDMSLMFYFPEMRVIPRRFGGGKAPDYIIARRLYPLSQDAEFLDSIKDIHYRSDTLPYPDIVWSNNPDPLFHMYRNPEGKAQMKIFRKEL